MLVAFVKGETRSARVQEWFAVHQKSIPMVTVSELHLEQPTAVHLPLHGMRSGIPVVEISGQDNGRCGRRGAIEADGLGRVSPPIAIDAGRGRRRIHSGMVVGAGF